MSEAQERQPSTETGAFSLLPLSVSQSCALQFHLCPGPAAPHSRDMWTTRTVLYRIPAWPGPAVTPGTAQGCRGTARAESGRSTSVHTLSWPPPGCTQTFPRPQDPDVGLGISWDAAGCPVFPISSLGNKLENLPKSISGDSGDSGPNSHSLVCKQTQLYLGQGWIHSASP